MLIPTAIATKLAAEIVAGRRGAARHRLSRPHPFAGFARARAARRPAACVTC